MSNEEGKWPDPARLSRCAGFALLAAGVRRRHGNRDVIIYVTDDVTAGFSSSSHVARGGGSSVTK